MKSNIHGSTHEAVIKNDGSYSYDVKWDILEVRIFQVFILIYYRKEHKPKDYILHTT
jgi:hypothetical protein